METILLFIFLVFFVLLFNKKKQTGSCNCSNNVEHFLPGNKINLINNKPSNNSNIISINTNSQQFAYSSEKPSLVKTNIQQFAYLPLNYEYQKEFRLPIKKNSNLEYLNTDKYFKTTKIKESLTFSSLRQILDEIKNKLNYTNINFNIIKAIKDKDLDNKLNIYKPLLFNIIGYINSYSNTTLAISNVNITNFESYTDNIGTKFIKCILNTSIDHPYDNIYKKNPIKCELNIHLILKKNNNNLDIFIKDIYSLDWRN